MDERKREGVGVGAREGPPLTSRGSARRLHPLVEKYLSVDLSLIWILPRPAPIHEYLPPERTWDVVSIDLPQLPASHQDSRYILVCADLLFRYVVGPGEVNLPSPLLMP